jgi:hypothetical protein
MLDDRGHRQRLDRRGISVERLHLDLESGIGRGENAVAGLLVTLDPVLPASRGHPEAVDQDNGVRGGRVGAHAAFLQVRCGVAVRASWSLPRPLGSDRTGVGASSHLSCDCIEGDDFVVVEPNGVAPHAEALVGEAAAGRGIELPTFRLGRAQRRDVLLTVRSTAREIENALTP